MTRSIHVYLACSGLALALLLIAGFLVDVPPVVSQVIPGTPVFPPPPPDPTPEPAPDEIFYVDWHITASGEAIYTGDAGYRDTKTHHIAVNGSTVVLKQAGKPLVALPFILQVTDDHYRLVEDFCGWVDRRVTLVDPARYMGGPDPLWTEPSFFARFQREDGSWYMYDPFYWFMGHGGANRLFTIREDVRVRDHCIPESVDTTQTYLGNPFSFFSIGQGPGIIEGDSTGAVFTRNETFIDSRYDPALTVHFEATIRTGCTGAMNSTGAARRVDGAFQPVCGCASLPPGTVIDANSPLARDLSVTAEFGPHRIWPDASKTLTFFVTCEGRPVKNAELEVSVKPDEKSGGHPHGGADRPRGFLNKKRITNQQPSVIVKSNGAGAASVEFAPGEEDAKDTLTGIAGLYRVRARSKKYPYSASAQAEAYVHAVVLDLQKLASNDNVFVSERLYSGIHDSGNYGTAQTLIEIRILADLFRQSQENHNQDLAFYGFDPWPIVPIVVYDISLEDGGQYDLSGQWRRPYRRHAWGLEALIRPGHTEVPAPFTYQQGRAWFDAQLWSYGQLFGRWFTDGGTKWNLAFFRPRTGAVHTPRSASEPDLSLFAFLSTPEDRLTAGAGQTVTYTLALENLVRSTVAHGVVLTATLPSGLSFLHADPPSTRMVGADQVVWELETLPARAVPTLFDLGVRIEPAIEPGTPLTVTAQVAGVENDPTPQDNRFEAGELIVQPAGADLVVYSTADATAMTISEPVTFTVSVANQGNLIAAGSRLTLTLPASVTLVGSVPAAAFSGADWAAWEVGDMEPEASSQVTVSTSLDPSLLNFVSVEDNWQEPEGITFTLTAHSSTFDFDLANNREETGRPVVLPGPDLHLSFAVDGAPAPGMLAENQSVTYTIHYANLGNRIAPSAVLSFSLWSGLTVVQAQPAITRTATNVNFGGGVYGWDLGDLAVGESGALQVQIHVDEVGERGSLILAAIESVAPDLNYADNVAISQPRAQEGVTYRVLLPLMYR